ncbi:alpha/beta hydrolase [Runella rosea]|uniref:Alpha/beta hydrolase n=1 Tax=Runella rosea TaxID=2259595 RepID=A0A344TSL3_9BACT|nr:alpha/beta fold hydrolase [Runella rosea]AXE21634.1 alpha/beta hydrolase [Runella rosea]
MPVISTNTHRPPSWLPNGHYQSIYPALFRTVNPSYQRERLTTPDDDFLDIDWSFAKKNKTADKKETAKLPTTLPPLVILSHGLEGSSTRQYITGMVKFLTTNGFDCLAWNYRSCSGEINRQLRFYHSGETTDLEFVIQHALAKGYTEINLMGFSLGGNVTLKYVGENGANIHPAIKKAVAFSVPMDLLACSRNIEKPENKIYLWRFLKSLKPKVTAKAQQYPEHFDLNKWKYVKTFWDFDHVYTGPLHGFEGADDYYQKSSSKGFIHAAAIPTLIVNAVNDPLVPYQSLPADVIANMPNVWLELTQSGGHCGFRPDTFSHKDAYWSEVRALTFLTEP